MTNAPKHFALDPRKLSLAEYWRAPQRGSFLAGLVIKALRLEVDTRRAVPLTDELIELDPDDLPAAAQRLQPTVAELEQLGFELAFYYREDVVIADGELAAVVLLAPDARTYASAISSSAIVAGKRIEQLHAGFISRLDRRVVVTGTTAAEMDSPPEFDGEIVLGTLAHAYARHCERIADQRDTYRGSPAAAVLDPAELRRFVVAISRRVVEHGVARGVFKPLPPERVQALRRGVPSALAKRPPSVKTVVLLWIAVAVLVAIIALL